MIIKASRAMPYILEFAFELDYYNLDINKNYIYNFGNVVEIESEDSALNDNSITTFTAEENTVEVQTEKGLLISNIKNQLFKARNPHTPGSDAYYGFIWGTSLPSGTLSSSNLPSYNISYAAMTDFRHLTSSPNICGATAGYNAVAYYRAMYADPITAAERDTVFNAIGDNIGLSITLRFMFRNGLTNYIATQPLYSLEQLGQSQTWANFKSNVSNGRVSYLILWNPITAIEGHLILGVGIENTARVKSFVGLLTVGITQ